MARSAFEQALAAQPRGAQRPPTPTRTTWRSGCSAADRPGSRRASCTSTTTSRTPARPTRARSCRSRRTTSRSPRPSSTTPTGSGTTSPSRTGWVRRRCSDRAGRTRRACSRRRRQQPPDALLQRPHAVRRDGQPARRGRPRPELSVRLCVSAAEPLAPEVLRRWQNCFGLDIVDGIGSTEMLHIYCSNRPGDVRPGTSGKPVPGYELSLLDENDQPGAPTARSATCTSKVTVRSPITGTSTRRPRPRSRASGSSPATATGSTTTVTTCMRAAPTT